MANLSRTYPRRALTGLAFALIIGVTVVAVSNIASAVVRDFPLTTLWDDASISQIAIASAAFMLLALLGISAPRPWIVALFITVGLWAFYVYGITRPYEGGGANIGLGILMMFSPLPIAVTSLLSLVISAYRRKADGLPNVR